MAESFGVVFQGNSESECINFVRAVRRYAKENGRVRDNAWIADEIYDAFDGKALKWYARLPEDVQGDWGRLQEALLSHWTTDDDDNDNDISTGVSSLAILPTPAAAPAASPPNPAPSRTFPQSDWTAKVGRARIRANGIAGVRYLSKDCPTRSSGCFIAAANPALALKVRLITTTPDFYRMEIVEHESGLSVLAAYYYPNPGWVDASGWSGLIGVDTSGQGLIKDHRTTFNVSWRDCHFWTERWKIESTGILKLCGPGDTAETARFVLGVTSSVQDLLLLGRPNYLAGPSYVQADLEFEPLVN